MTETVLKPRWQWVKFGDVVRKISKKVDPQSSGLERYIAGEHMDTDDLRIRRWGEISDNYLGPAFHIYFKPGQVLYGSRRTYLRKVAVPDFEGICANTTFVLESKDPRVLLPELLPFIMQTEAFHEHSMAQSKGSVNPYVNFSDLAWYEFALPPLEVQAHLISLLNASLNVVNSYSDLNVTLNAQYLSMLVHIFQLKLQASVDIWKIDRVGNRFHIQLGKMSSAASREAGNQKKYLKNNNVKWGFFDFTELSEMAFDSTEQEKFSLQSGDLLVCEGGEIGRAAIWYGEREDIFYQKALHRLRPKDPRDSTEFFMHYLRFCALRGILDGISTGTTISHLPAQNLAALKLPFPSFDDQQAILRLIKASWSAIDSARDKAQVTRRLHKRLVAKSTEADVRVPAHV